VGCGFRHTRGADVESDGQERHSVFVTKSEKRAVVVANMEAAKSITAEVKLPNPGTLIFRSQWID
jgi:hypothetical protein